jgi:acyl carrier protein phosphodiesterase
MNHLAHFKLASSHPQLILGNFLADDTKGRLVGRFDAGVEAGIQLHRAIDAYTDSHPLVQASHARFDAPYRRYGGIITDIVYDHFLARHWLEYDQQSLEHFCRDTLQELMHHAHVLPAPSLERARRMQKSRSMEHYGSTAFIERSFNYLSGKLKRENPLANGFSQFEKHAQTLESDFAAFFPAVQAFASNWVEQHDGRLELRNIS